MTKKPDNNPATKAKVKAKPHKTENEIFKDHSRRIEVLEKRLTRLEA